MFSKRFRNLCIRKKENIPDWALLAYVIYTIKHYPKSLLAIEFGDLKNKFLGD